MNRDPAISPITAPINVTLTPGLCGAMNAIVAVVVSFSCYSVIRTLVIVDKNSSVTVLDGRSDLRVDSVVVPTDVDPVVVCCSVSIVVPK